MISSNKFAEQSEFNFLNNFTPSSFHVNPPVTPSLINYVPSSIGGSYQSTIGDNTSVPSYSAVDILINDIEEQKNDFKEGRCAELWRTFRDEAGLWLSHRFTLDEWSDTERRSSKFKREFDDFDGILTPKMVSSGLSKLDRCPMYFHYTYIKCVLSKLKLIDIEALRSFHYLQYLDVSGNRLTTLQALGNMPFLKYLDASHNCLTYILDFKPPYFLTTINLAHNRFKTLRNLSEFWSITDLNLSHNGIRIIEGLKGLRYLTTLNLSFNRIENIENLENLRIQNLYLQSNLIKSYDDDDTAMFHTLSNIRSINLSNNQLSSLKMFEFVENLECLEASNNFISTLLDVYYLRNLKYLNRLNLSGNPVKNLKRYAEVCITQVRNLHFLDGEHINNEFWLQKISDSANDVSQNAARQRLKLLILEQLNQPQIWNWLLPYDSPPLSIIVLVGLQASKRAYIARKFCRQNDNVVVGIPYTTKPKYSDEIDGEHFYYVSEEEFRDMLKRGEFLTYSESMGYNYGFTHKEFKKAENTLLLLYTELTMALCIKSRFLNTKLILALPSSRRAHLENLKKLYALRLMDVGIQIITSPIGAKYAEKEFEKERRVHLKNDIATIIDNVIDRVLDCKTSKERGPSADKIVRPRSEIVQLWAASANAGHMSHVINLSTSSYPVPDDIAKEGLDQSGHTERYHPQVPKYVSFTVAHVQSFEKNEDASKQEEVSSNVQVNDESEEAGRKVDASAKVRYEEVAEYNGQSDSVDMENRVRSTGSQPSVNFFMDHKSYGDVLTDDERIYSIFKCELNKRDELLDLHWSTPGLFRELIFTDREEETIEKLGQLTKTLKKSNDNRERAMMNFENDGCYKKLTEEKIKRCFVSLHREVSISDKQAAEYFIEDTPHICIKGDCRNPLCPPF